MRILVVAALLALAPAAAFAQELPQSLAPSENFPHILAQAPSFENVAPGVEYAEYSLVTTDGPMVVRVIAAQLRRSDVHVSTILAHDALTSAGETVGSMGKRTGAVAGINGDYFDVGNTNRPTNIVVREGQLLRMPRKRFALAVTRDGGASIDEFSFTGQISIGDKTFGLDGIDELPPPDGGISLITPEFGSIPPLENVTLVQAALLSGIPPLARFRVSGIADNLSRQPPGYYIAIGPSAYGQAGVPNPGDVAEASGDLSPVGLEQIAAAIGGGPLILHQGVWYDDPDGPNGGEYAKRIPASGAAIEPDGTLLLIEVDGRQPLLSVGIERHAFSALMRALGATEGMAFDGGGSSTIVARRIGDSDATMQNSPSDGIERPVSNGIFVYSTAPAGPPARLVARPGTIRALPGATVALRLAAVDSANHVVPPAASIVATVEPPSLGRVGDARFVALAPGTGRIVLHGGALSGSIPVEVTRSPARVLLSPPEPNVERNGMLQFSARALDARGYALDLPAFLPWSATGGSIDARGIFRATDKPADVSLTLGDAVGRVRVTVGSHEVTLPFSEHAHFVTVPRGGAGNVARDPACGSCLSFDYAFAANERAAYAMAEIPLPPGTIGVSFDVNDDGGNARLRVAVRNSINEDLFVDATALNGTGWRHVTVRFPPEAAQPVKLVAIYLLPPKGMQESNGSIGLRNVRAIVAGN
jgi:Phosphodiester glycosidase